MGAFSGPNVVEDSDYLYHVCASSGTFIPNFSGTVEYLVVAGGAGGGMDMGGGGGGGGVLSGSTSVTAGTSYTVTVGAGGTGAPAGNVAGNPNFHQFTIAATNGGNSVFGSLTAVGGGFGGSSVWSYTPGGPGGSGGSGGGASGYNSTSGAGGGSGTAGQGNRGGNAGGNYYSGGGGGAGAAGTDGASTPNGGAGILNNILGFGYYWAGGGGGASYSSGVGGNGGLGGGGGGSSAGTAGAGGLTMGQNAGTGGGGDWVDSPGGNGGRNTGGGGGGGMHYNRNNQGGNGGSGIVVIRYSKTLGQSAFSGSPAYPLNPIIFSMDAANTGKGFAVECLVVAGGGGAGMDMGGGGGGGQVTQTVVQVVNGIAYPVTVGAGGAGSTGPYAGPPVAGSPGGASTFGGVFMFGGGGGGSGHYYPYPYAGQQGQDGGNAGGDSPLWGRNRGSGQTSSFGGYNGGGAGFDGDGSYTAGGGGGAAGPGDGGRGSWRAGNGGIGLLSSINGTSLYWGGGGGGSGWSNTAGAGGAGGGGGGSAAGGGTANSGGSGLNTGGSGAAGTNSNGGNAGANTGGGGGGGTHATSVGGNGGSGIVIIRYYGSQKATGGSIYSSGGYTVHAFTSSGTFTPTENIGVSDMGPFNYTNIVYSANYNSSNGGNYAFDGTTNNAIQITDSLTKPGLINLKTSQGGQGYTVIIWAKSTGGGGSWRKLLGYGDGENYIELYQNLTGYWHQDGSGDTLYVDGVVVSNDSYQMINSGWHCYAATNSNSGTLTNPSQLLTIGNEPNLSSYPWVGNIASVKIYNRVLTSDELLQEFYALRGRFGI